MCAIHSVPRTETGRCATRLCAAHEQVRRLGRRRRPYVRVERGIAEGRQAQVLGYPGNVGCAVAVFPEPARDLLGPDRGRPPQIDREDARRLFVDQAARESLSATLTPSTAAGGADGERCTSWPPAIAATTSTSSTRCSSSSSRSSAAIRGARCATGSGSLARPRPMRSAKANDRPRSVKCRLRSRSYNSPNGAMGQ